MLNTVYEKPKMEFVNVQNENKIANTCWGYGGTDTLLYCYDIYSSKPKFGYD